MILEHEGPRVPQYILNRQARVAIAVVERHADKPFVASIAATLVPRANAFIQSYEAASVQKSQRTEQLRVAQGHLATLFRVTSTWLAPVQRDVEGFDSRGHNSQSQVAIDVISDAERLIEVIEARGDSLPYKAVALEELRAAVEQAVTAYEQGQNARVELQQLQAQIREAARDLQKELVALRRALRAAFGASHVDYQRLRTPQRTVADEQETTELDAFSGDSHDEPEAPTNGASTTIATELGLPEGVAN